MTREEIRAMLDAYSDEELLNIFKKNLETVGIPYSENGSAFPPLSYADIAEAEPNPIFCEKTFSTSICTAGHQQSFANYYIQNVLQNAFSNLQSVYSSHNTEDLCVKNMFNGDLNFIPAA